MGYKLSQLTEQTFPSLLGGDWDARRSSIAATWQHYLGWLPDSVPPRYTVRSEHREVDHIRIHLTYETGFGDRVYAYLLIPGSQSSPQTAERLYPAMLALHPTDPKGKADIASNEGRANRKYALELVARGYVVLAPDTITAGERIYAESEAFQTASFYASFPNSTAVGKMIHDHQQGIDLLQALPYVDPERIGAIGHSLGAYNAYFLAGVDERIKAVVSSCGFSPFMQDPNPNRWGQRDWFSHIPKLTADIENDYIPFEFHEIVALMAPKPLFNWVGQNDAIFPNWQAAAFASQDVHRLYERLGALDRYCFMMGNEGHDFPEPIRAMSYQFLDRWLQEDISI